MKGISRLKFLVMTGTRDFFRSALRLKALAAVFTSVGAFLKIRDDGVPARPSCPFTEEAVAPDDARRIFTRRKRNRVEARVRPLLERCFAALPDGKVAIHAFLREALTPWTSIHEDYNPSTQVGTARWKAEPEDATGRPLRSKPKKAPTNRRRRCGQAPTTDG